MGTSYVTPTQSGLPIQHFLTIDGTPSGEKNAIVDYSTAPVDFWWQASKPYDIHSVLINISESTAMNQSDYGSLAGGITNGVKLFVVQRGVEIPLLGGFAVKKNYEWTLLTVDCTLTTYPGSAQTYLVNFDLISQYGVPIPLAPGDKFIVRLNDNFTGLVNHTFGLRGIGYW